MRSELHALFKGNVQGVGFRYIAQQFARTLQLTGTIQNLPDGSVEIFAQGPKEKLEQLCYYLKNEAFLNEIKSAEITYSLPSKEYTDFSILR
jgi:acylphosphatase